MILQAQREVQGRAELFAATPPTQMQVRLARGTDGAERSSVQLVSGEFFQAMRQRAQLGRLIEPRDNAEAGASPVMVISDGYWARRFQRNPAIVGRELIVGGVSLTVIGVAEPGFFGPYLALRNPEVWIPVALQIDIRYAFNASTSDGADVTKPWFTQPGIEWLTLFARVPVEADVAGVGAALTLVHQRDAVTRVDASNADGRAELQSERVLLSSAGRGFSFLRGDFASRLYVLLAMVGVLMAITCGNVASLLVARASAREREIAVRTALGAGRWRVVRQLLIETLILSSAGGALGLLLAAWGRDLLLRCCRAARRSRSRHQLRLARPAVRGFGDDDLRPAGRYSARASQHAHHAKRCHQSAGAPGGMPAAAAARGGRVLVTAQMAFCVLLLVVAGLFVRSMQALMLTDVGYDRDRLLVARLDVRSMGYSDDQRQALYDRVLERLRRIPGCGRQPVDERADGHLTAQQQPRRRRTHAGAE